MSGPVPYSGRVMISSVMEGFNDERTALAAIITQAGLTPWYADDPPNEILELHPLDASFAMARRCDLYLLVIFPRYGSQPLSDSTHSVTHQEFVEAVTAHPRAVRAFILAEALRAGEADEELHAFIQEVMGFEHGRWTIIVQNETELREKVQHSLEVWQRDGELGRNTYIQAVRSEYRRFRNPATGQEMDYGATVQLKLRAQLSFTQDRPEWGQPEFEGEGKDGERRDSDHLSTERGRPRRESKRNHELERLHEVTQSPPEVATALLTQHQRLVILGDVGSGKSTLLKRLAHDTAEAYQHGQESRLPILVSATRLGALARQYVAEPLAELVGRVQEEETRTEALRPTIRSTVSNAIANGQALLMVDGLDEATPAEQAAVLTSFGQIGSNWAVLASRPAAYHGQPPGWQVADLLPLGVSQRRDLVLQVFHLERLADESLSTEEALMAEAAELELALQQRKADLAAWAGNPLLLTLIAVQFTRDHRLPASRAHIYEFAIEDLQRQRPTTARRYLTNSQLQYLLQTVSLRMQEAVRRSATMAEIRDTYLQSELAEFGDISMRTAVTLEILLRSGVLQAERARGAQDIPTSPPIHAQDQDSYTFIHLSFREYLAACAMMDLPFGALQNHVKLHVRQREWEQVFQLLVNRLDASGHEKDADVLIGSLLAADVHPLPNVGGMDPTHLALRLASRCILARGRRGPDSLRDKVCQAWWKVWCQEERRQWDLSEVDSIILTPYEDGDERSVTELAPTYLVNGLPFVWGRLIQDWQYWRSRWWRNGMLAALGAVALVAAVGQVTLGVPFLASTGWGHWLAGRLPILVLMTIGTLVTLRLYGLVVRVHMVRHRLLVSVLQKREANQALEQLGDVQAVEPLIAALRDSDSRVRQAAALALAQLGDVQAVEPLLAALRDRRSDVRQAVAQALGQLGDVSTVEPLLNILHDANRYYFAQEAAAQALRQLSDVRAVEPLIAALHDSDSRVRQAAAQALGQLGDVQAVEPLIAALPNNKVSQQAVILALGQLGDVRAVEPLVTILRDANYYNFVRQAAAQALAQLGDVRAVEPLMAALHDANYDVRKAAAQALGQLSDVRAVEPLIAALRDAIYDVRQAAILALGQLGDVSTVEPLLAALRDGHEDVRRAAALALGRRGDIQAVEPLLTILRDANYYEDVRQAAAQALGQLGDVRAVEPLIAALRDSDSRVRQAAALALGQLGDVRAVEPLIAALHDANYYVQQAVILALGQLGDVRAVEPLVTILRDRRGDVRQAAAQALAQLGDVRAVEPLMAALRRASFDVQQAVILVLGRLSDLRQFESLVTIIRDSHNDARQAAAQALGQLGGTALAQRVVRLAQRFPSWWVHLPLALLRGITDWVLLFAVLAAQVVILIPPLAQALPPPFHWLFGLTDWWQSLLLVGLFIVGYVGYLIGSVVIHGLQEGRGVWLDAAEQFLRR